MICWIGKETNDILDRHNVGVIGFDMRRESSDARCVVLLNETRATIRLGNVEGLTHREMERRFAAAMLQLAFAAEQNGDREGYVVLDELLSSLNGRPCLESTTPICEQFDLTDGEEEWEKGRNSPIVYLEVDRLGLSPNKHRSDD